jgi:putative oxidoreductase
MLRLLRLDGLAAGQDLVLLVLRLLTGSFLVWAMWPNVSSAETMAVVVGVFRDMGFVYPEVFAPLSAWAQFLIGIALILGLLTRLVGLALAFNFVVGLYMAHMADSFRGQWPAWALLGFGLLFAAFGAGRFSLDRLWTR